MKKIYGILLALIVIVNSFFVSEVSFADNEEDVSSGKTSTKTENVENLSNVSEAKTSKPKLIIDNYSVRPNPIKAGEAFDLTISFYNTNKNKSIKNIKVVLNSSGGSTMDGSQSEDDSPSRTGAAPSLNGSVFMPVGSSNTFYIESIRAGRKAERTIKLTSPYDISPNTYELGVTLEYEDSNNNEYVVEESLGINLYQEAKLQIGTMPAVEGEAGVDYPFEVPLYNTGRSAVYNMMIKMEGEFDVIGDTYYIGTFQPGSTESFATTIIGIEPGTTKGNLIITYEDSTGKSHEIKEEFTANFMEMIQEEFDESMIEEEKEPIYKNIVFWMIIIAVIVIIIVIIAVVIRKKKKNKENDELIIDDELDDKYDTKEVEDKSSDIELTQRIDTNSLEDEEDNEN
ncbi:COG1361 S-layer family protein [Miniphocaeibacter massiliensis]|uniref:COG1361 S-layer family protein n=1 Tax=Miniphocaeibacter massiliensis TaxID=2041841 RepID=UPI000C080174|nr:hypothetical protein [Miniphocaeibacter massiliensis]